MSQQPDLSRERRLWAQGTRYIAGIDEAGRGAWAGPVVAAACVLPPNATDLALWLAPVRDSKLLSPQRREVCYDLICQHALAYGVGQVSAQEIDRVGILPATRRAMQLALEALAIAPEHLLVDAVTLLEVPLPQQAIIKGDRDCLSIAAASILAKVTRDHGMVALDKDLPGYGLAQHKGYGTRAHLAALQALGTTPQHRHTYAPIRDLDARQRAHEAQND